MVTSVPFAPALLPPADTVDPPVRARAMAWYLVAVAALVAIVAGVGVFDRGDLATETVTTPRGETYEVVTEGIYAWNAERVVAEGVGWDLATLLLAVPALLSLVRSVARGSLRGRLLATGLLAYLAYQYLMYAVTWAVGPLLLPFVVVFVASVVGIAWFAGTIGLDRLARHVGDGFPRRSMAVFSVLMALLLLGMWLPMVAEVLGGELEGRLNGQTTLVVQALDLGIVVPLAVATAVLVWRRRPLGYLLAATLVVKGVAMATAITAMVLVAGQVEGELQVGFVAIFTVAAVACALLLRAMYRAIREGPVPAPAPGAPPV